MRSASTIAAEIALDAIRRVSRQRIASVKISPMGISLIAAFVAALVAALVAARIAARIAACIAG